MINNNEIKRNIYNVYDIVRILWNNYYNGVEEYTENDLKGIEYMIANLNATIKELKESVDYEYRKL